MLAGGAAFRLWQVQPAKPCRSVKIFCRDRIANKRARRTGTNRQA